MDDKLCIVEEELEEEEDAAAIFLPMKEGEEDLEEENFLGKQALLLPSYEFPPKPPQCWTSMLLLWCLASLLQN
eukprot:3142593-Ditylum_brightwellii.AAC.1